MRSSKSDNAAEKSTPAASTTTTTASLPQNHKDAETRAGTVNTYNKGVGYLMVGVLGSMFLYAATSAGTILFGGGLKHRRLPSVKESVEMSAPKTEADVSTINSVAVTFPLYDDDKLTKIAEKKRSVLSNHNEKASQKLDDKLSFNLTAVDTKPSKKHEEPAVIPPLPKSSHSTSQTIETKPNATTAQSAALSACFNLAQPNVQLLSETVSKADPATVPEVSTDNKSVVKSLSDVPSSSSRPIAVVPVIGCFFDRQLLSSSNEVTTEKANISESRCKHVTFSKMQTVYLCEAYEQRLLPKIQRGPPDEWRAYGTMRKMHEIGGWVLDKKNRSKKEPLYRYVVKDSAPPKPPVADPIMTQQEFFTRRQFATERRSSSSPSAR